MFSIVIPSYNEEQTLNEASYVEHLVKTLDVHFFGKYEIILVDDGSTDNTPNIFKKFGEKFKQIRIYTHALNKGYGSALKSGINFANNDTIIITDIDGTYNSDSVLEIINLYFDSKKNSSNGIDMVVASRKGSNSNENLFKSILRYLLKTLVQWSSGSKVDDINSGLRVFSKNQIIKLFPDLSNYFSFTTTSTLVYLSNNLTVSYHPIKYLKRQGRDSHVRLFRDSLRTLQYVIETTIHYNPLKFFLLISLFFFILSLISIIVFLIRDVLILESIFLINLSLSLFSLIIGFLSVLIRKTIKNK